MLSELANVCVNMTVFNIFAGMEILANAHSSSTYWVHTCGMLQDFLEVEQHPRCVDHTFFCRKPFVFIK